VKTKAPAPATSIEPAQLGFGLLCCSLFFRKVLPVFHPTVARVLGATRLIERHSPLSATASSKTVLERWAPGAKTVAAQEPDSAAEAPRQVLPRSL
jgi:hypothetical protein